MAVNDLRDLLYGMEDDKNKLWLDVLNSFAGFFYILRDLVSSAVSKMKYGTFAGYDVGVPITRFANVMVDAVVHGYEWMTATSKKKREKAADRCLDDTMRGLLMSQGLPYDAPKKLVVEPIIKMRD